MMMSWRWLTAFITNSRIPRHCRISCYGSIAPVHKMKKAGIPRIDVSVSPKYHLSHYTIVLQRYRFTG